MKSWQKAELACAKFETRAIEKGAIVSRPSTDQCPYDRVVDWEGKLYRVQVKFAGMPSANAQGAVLLDIRRRDYLSDKPSGSKSGKYNSGDIDVLVVYVSQVDAICWLTPEMFENKTSISLRYEPAANGQTRNLLFVEDVRW